MTQNGRKDCTDHVLFVPGLFGSFGSFDLHLEADQAVCHGQDGGESGGIGSHAG